MEKNMSILLCNQEKLTSFIRPQPMNVIHIGGLHIMKKPAALPNVIITFLHNSISLLK